MKDDHVNVNLGEYEVPLIGIKKEFGLEICDLCGNDSLRLWIDIDEPDRRYACMAGNGKNIYCNKCID